MQTGLANLLGQDSLHHASDRLHCCWIKAGNDTIHIAPHGNTLRPVVMEGDSRLSLVEFRSWSACVGRDLVRIEWWPSTCFDWPSFDVFYTWERLVEDAQGGNLFTCHLVREAVPIYDPDGALEKLNENFILRRSYATEIQQASDLGWFLDRHGSEIRPTVVARRMIWCIRTILIARSAEAGSPVFAPEALAQITQSEAARELLVERHQRRVDASSRYKFRSFLKEEAAPLPFSDSWSVAEFEERFSETKNQVGLQTLNHGERATDDAGSYNA